MRRAVKTTKSKIGKRHAPNSSRRTPTSAKVPFIEHLYELRRRLFYVALAVGAGATVAYNFHKQITNFLLWPAGEQQFIFTSPGGGFEFLFRICMYTGLVIGIPVIIFQILRYLQPIIPGDSMRFISWGTAASAVLAVVGMVFGYFFGLPAALDFLLKNFSYDQINALISIQSYMSFITMYLLGSALIFQVPLILLLINRIKPLKPSKLFLQQRWVIVGSLVLAAIITPAPDIPNLLILAVPMVLMYQLGIVLVWKANRKLYRSKRVLELLEKDAQERERRLQEFAQAQAARQAIAQTRLQARQQPAPVVRRPQQRAVTAARPKVTDMVPAPRRQYVNDVPASPLRMRRRPLQTDGGSFVAS